MSARLPDYPWDRLVPHRQTAASHPGGIVDLSVGTPVDPVPEVARAALAEGSVRSGYPQTYGTAALRETFSRWLERRLDVPGVDPTAVLPTIGSKELVAWLPTLLGLGHGDQVALPSLGYPTYDIGVRLAGAEPVVTDDPTSLDPGRAALVWVNTPSNPTGAVLAAPELARIVAWAREHGALVASDECYIELGWEARPVSILHPEVCGGSFDSLLAVHSLSKRSNLAGYRAGFVTGDAGLVRELLEVRRHSGLIVPWPVQYAMAAALDDDGHARDQRARYAARREVLRPALEAAGWRISHSEAGLYLWATHPAHDCWGSVGALAELGVLVAPGEFYGDAGRRHVRVALTATDERVHAAAARLRALS